jgi:hypothetical protein
VEHSLDDYSLRSKLRVPHVVPDQLQSIALQIDTLVSLLRKVHHVRQADMKVQLSQQHLE